MTTGTTEGARRHRAPADFRALQAHLECKGWTDGLPVIPPTEELVREMIAAGSAPAQELLGVMEPVKGKATIEKVAANAVMAGCEPRYFPVVLAAVRAVLQPKFNVGSTACTTGGAAPVVVVSGPIAAEVGINAGTSCFGGNVKANATIGRALRLVMRNLGGAKPDGMEKSTQGWPGKLSMCFAENEARNPLEPFRVSQGIDASRSAVSVLAVRGIYAVTEGVQQTGEGVLETIAGSMRTVGAPIYYQMGVPVIVCLGPEHAAEIAAAGYTRQSLQQYFFEHCRLPVATLRNRGYFLPNCWPASIDPKDDAALVPMVSEPRHFWIVVAGGDGRHSAWMPAWNVCEGATEEVR